MLMTYLTKGTSEKRELQLNRRSAQLIIDGQALIQSLGKPPDASTFGDLADNFIKSLTHQSKTFHRIDVTFDRYIPGSVKGATRKRRSEAHCPIRRAIDGRHVPLPQSWNNFLAMTENKSDLAQFLFEEIIKQGMWYAEIVVARGFEDGTDVQHNKRAEKRTDVQHDKGADRHYRCYK